MGGVDVERVALQLRTDLKRVLGAAEIPGLRDEALRGLGRLRPHAVEAAVRDLDRELALVAVDRVDLQLEATVRHLRDVGDVAHHELGSRVRDRDPARGLFVRLQELRNRVDLEVLVARRVDLDLAVLDLEEGEHEVVLRIDHDGVVPDGREMHVRAVILREEGLGLGAVRHAAGVVTQRRDLALAVLELARAGDDRVREGEVVEERTARGAHDRGLTDMRDHHDARIVGVDLVLAHEVAREAVLRGDELGRAEGRIELADDLLLDGHRAEGLGDVADEEGGNGKGERTGLRGEAHERFPLKLHTKTTERGFGSLNWKGAGVQKITAPEKCVKLWTISPVSWTHLTLI